MNPDSQRTGTPSISANLSKAIATKLKPTSAASLFTIMAALVLNACAAPGTLTDAEPQTKMRLHSHLQEKTGILPSASEPLPDKPNAANDRTRHFHRRDGKQLSVEKPGCRPGFFV